MSVSQIVGKDIITELLSLFGVVFGGGVITSLARRREDLRKVAAEADVTYSQAANSLITQLQQDGATNRAIVEKLQQQVETIREKYDQSQRDHYTALDTAHTENTTLTERLARLQTDLDAAQRRITDLTTPHQSGA